MERKRFATVAGLLTAFAWAFVGPAMVLAEDVTVSPVPALDPANQQGICDEIGNRVKTLGDAVPPPRLADSTLTCEFKVAVKQPELKPKPPIVIPDVCETAMKTRVEFKPSEPHDCVKWVQARLLAWEIERDHGKDFQCGYLKDGKKGCETDKAICDFREIKELKPTKLATIDSSLLEELRRRTDSEKEGKDKPGCELTPKDGKKKPPGCRKSTSKEKGAVC